MYALRLSAENRLRIFINLSTCVPLLLFLSPSPPAQWRSSASLYVCSRRRSFDIQSRISTLRRQKSTFSLSPNSPNRSFIKMRPFILRPLLFKQYLIFIDLNFCNRKIQPNTKSYTIRNKIILGQKTRLKCVALSTGVRCRVVCLRVNCGRNEDMRSELKVSSLLE